jgi:hypothetical protein
VPIATDQDLQRRGVAPRETPVEPSKRCASATAVPHGRDDPRRLARRDAACPDLVRADVAILGAAKRQAGISLVRRAGITLCLSRGAALQIVICGCGTGVCGSVGRSAVVARRSSNDSAEGEKRTFNHVAL